MSRTFTDLAEAWVYYAACSAKGLPATLQTDIPCKQWTVKVYK